MLYSGSFQVYLRKINHDLKVTFEYRLNNKMTLCKIHVTCGPLICIQLVNYCPIECWIMDTVITNIHFASTCCSWSQVHFIKWSTLSECHKDLSVISQRYIGLVASCSLTTSHLENLYQPYFMSPYDTRSQWINGEYLIPSEYISAAFYPILYFSLSYWRVKQP